MIIKFDHISYIAPRDSKDSILKKMGINATFIEEGLKNLNNKKQLMKNPLEKHDLYFYDVEYPVEYIFYDHLNSADKLTGVTLTDSTLYGYYNDYDKAISFLQCVFGSNKIQLKSDRSIYCNMKGVLDKRDYPLVLQKKTGDIDTYLDDPGFGVVGLIHNNIFNRVDFAKAGGGKVTETESLRVNGKILDICFAKSNHINLIFELIRTKGKER